MTNTIVFCASEFDEVEDDNEENIFSDDVDDEDYVEKWKIENTICSSTWEMFVSIRFNKSTVLIPDNKGICGFFCFNNTVWLDIVL